MKKSIMLVMCCVVLSASANAALALDRTRVIYDGGSKVETIKIKNPSEIPFLAQSWLTDIDGKDVEDKFIVIPPVIRIENKDYAMLRIRSLPTVSQLPQDRETAYFLHVREVPPSKHNNDNDTVANVATGSIQVAIESVIKFFYRPSSLNKIKHVDKAIVNGTKIKRTDNNKIVVENGSPFYVTYSELMVGKAKKDAEFTPVMLAPFTSRTLTVEKSDRYALSHINDYGATVTNSYFCNSQNICTARDDHEE
ncbi:molecular chaperone [Vibrio sp. 1S139]|uniref:fimbrial biogenesis chaperone n=1 Tax=Vibrio sp. 1S139 TaxID=3230006 RepID=UPI00352E8B5A